MKRVIGGGVALAVVIVVVNLAWIAVVVWVVLTVFKAVFNIK